MYFNIFFSAVALLLIFEGILPFLSPCSWRNIIQRVSAYDDKILRVSGFISMLIGVVILLILRNWFGL